jgi:HEAT repeats/PBS lyase HEAT-like repeat
MFDQEQWRQQIAERLGSFARNPRQEMQLAGSPSLLAYLVVQTLNPFLDAFQDEPIQAVLTLAEISRGPGANQIVKRAARRMYQLAVQIDRELRASAEMRFAAEQLLVELQALHIVRQRLNGSREEWLRTTLDHELSQFPSEFVHLRRSLHDQGGQMRLEALRRLRVREGRYTPGDIVLIHEGLSDSSATVRAQSARLLGMIAGSPPPLVARALLQVALHDCDAETRFASARAIGMLREEFASPQLLDYLSEHLFAEDRFHRAAAALVLGQLGELAASPTIVHHLAGLLNDEDAYAREAAARSLGKLGASAVTPEVIFALQRATQDVDVQVHEAATDALITLRDSRPEQEFELALSA